MTVRLELRCDRESPACRTARGQSPTRDALRPSSVVMAMQMLLRQAGEAGWVRVQRHGWICPECAEAGR